MSFFVDEMVYFFNNGRMTDGVILNIEGDDVLVKDPDNEKHLINEKYLGKTPDETLLKVLECTKNKYHFKRDTIFELYWKLKEMIENE